MSVCRPDVIRRIREQAQIVTLGRVQSGKQLADIVADAHAHHFVNSTLRTPEESEQVGAFLQQAQDWGESWDDIEAAGRVSAEFSMDQSVAALLGAGWSVHGGRTRRSISVMGKVSTIDVAVLAVVRGNPPVVFLDGDHFIVPGSDSP